MPIEADIEQELLNRQPDPMQALQKASRITNSMPAVTEGSMPLDPTMLRSIGKPVGELLGMVFKTKTGSKLPSLLRLTNWNAATGNVAMHSVNKAGKAFEATPAQIDEMIEKGWLDIAQPAKVAGDKIRGLLSRALGQ